jgi:hypothetical protein
MVATRRTGNRVRFLVGATLRDWFKKIFSPVKPGFRNFINRDLVLFS